MTQERIPRLAVLRDVAVFKLYTIAASQTKGAVTLRVLRGHIQAQTVGETFLQNALYNAADDDLVSSSQFLDPTEWQITGKGTIYVEQQLEKPDSAISQVADLGDQWLTSEEASATDKTKDLWKLPDELGTKDEKVLNEIKQILNEILNRLNTSELTQSEKAQASAPVVASTTIIEMPATKLALIRRMIRPLQDLASIAELVKRIVTLIS